MSVRTKVFSFQITTGIAGTVQTITGVGFEARFVKLAWNGMTNVANGIDNGSHQFGTGVAINTSFGAVTYDDYSVTTKSQNATGGVSNTATDVHELRSGHTILVGSNATEGAFRIGNWGSDGFDITINDQFLSAITFHCIAYTGNFSIEEVVTTEPAVAGNVNMVFAKKPDLLYVISNPVGAITSGISDDSRMSIGAASFRRNAIQQFSVTYGANDNVNPTNTECANRFDKFIQHINTAFDGTLTGQASITAIVGGTVTLNWDIVSGGANREHIVLGITGEEWEVGNFDTVAAGNNIVNSSLGFIPQGIEFYSDTHGSTAAGVTAAVDERVIGYVDSAGSQRSLTIEDSNGVAGTTRVSRAIQFDSVYASTNGASGPAIDARITYTSRQNNGFTLAQPTSDGTGRDVYFIASGSSTVSAQLLSSSIRENRLQIGSPAIRSF